MKRNKFTKVMVVLCVLSVLSTMAACGSKTTTEDTTSVVSTNSSNIEEIPQVEDGPLTKYDSTIEVSIGRPLEASIKYKEGDSLESNIWSKTLEEELGVKLKYAWTANTDQYNQKVNVSIASDDLPDIFTVNAAQLKQVVEGDKIQDLSESFEKYASDIVKNMVELGPNARKASTFNSKLMAVQPNEDYISQSNLIWVRTDWLKTLGLPEPKTIEDVYNIIGAFATKDPDGNGKNDTYGISFTKKPVGGGFSDLAGFANCFHAYPAIWVKDSSGKIVYGSIQPEMKQALQKVQELFKSGSLDKEFGVKDSNKVAEDITAGKIGLEFGAMWNPLWPLQTNIDKDAKAEWKSFPLVSVDAEPALPQQEGSFDSFVVEKKGLAHPEVIIKLWNIGQEKFFGKTADWEKYHNTPEGIEVWKYLPVIGGTNPQGAGYVTSHDKIMGALSSSDASTLSAEEKGYYDNIVKFRAGDRKLWAFERVFGEASAWATINETYAKNNLGVRNEFFGAATPTMVEKKATLQKMEEEVFIRIMLGKPVDEFDKFVSDWKKLGGDAMTAEVNDWYSSLK